MRLGILAGNYIYTDSELEKAKTEGLRNITNKTSKSFDDSVFKLVTMVFK